jgi:hypothetical protein
MAWKSAVNRKITSRSEPNVWNKSCCISGGSYFYSSGALWYRTRSLLSDADNSKYICCEDFMKRQIFLISFPIILLATSAFGFGQAGCGFNITGDWESTAPGQAGPRIYRFSPDGVVSVFSDAAKGQQPHTLGRAAYRLDNSQAPKVLEFRPIRGEGAFPWGSAKLDVARFDGASFTVVSSSSGSTAWARRDPNHYFIVLAAHRGTPPHKGGPAFATLIKTGGAEPQIESFGLFYRDGERLNGAVPDELYRQFLTEPVSQEDTVLRLQLTQQQFERGLKIVQDWQKRAREGTLLFPSYSYLNIVFPLKELVESLDQCGENVRLHQLTWMLDDEIGANVPQWELAFQYIRRLRQLNENLHVTGAQFNQGIRSQLVQPLSSQ